jgi:hypothetical protein
MLPIFWSQLLFLRLRVDPHGRIVSYHLTLFLYTSSQNRSLSWIPFRTPWEVWWSVMMGSLPCHSGISPHRHLLYLQIIRKRTIRIGAVKCVPTCTSIHFLDKVSSRLFFLRWRPTSTDSSSAGRCSWPSTLVWSAMNGFQSGLLDSRSPIQVTQWTIMGSYHLGWVPCLLLMPMDCAISQMHSLTILSVHCVVKPPSSCPVPMASAVHWLTPTPACFAQAYTCSIGFWIVLASATTDFGNQKASWYIFGFQWWLIIEWSILNVCYIGPTLGVLNISSRVMWCGSRGV